MPPALFYNQGTKRSYINATTIDCDNLSAANVKANSVSSGSLTGGAQNGLGQQYVDYNANVTTSNSLYIINKPALSNVATSGAYLSLSGTPTLSNVAITGAYASLSGRPANLSQFTNDIANYGNVVGNNLSITGASKVSTLVGNTVTLSAANTLPLFVGLNGTANTTGLAMQLSSTAGAADIGLCFNQAGVNSYGIVQRAGTSSTGNAGRVAFVQNLYPGNPGTEQMCILQNGSVGVNTTTPTSTLSVVGNASITGNLTAPLIQLPNASFSGKYSELQGVPAAANNAVGTFGSLSANTLTVSNATSLKATTATSLAANTMTLSTANTLPLFVGLNGTANTTGVAMQLSSAGGAGDIGLSFNQANVNSVGIVQRSGSSSTGNAGRLAIVQNLYPGNQGTEQVCVQQNGAVGIGTSSPAYTLDVSGAGRFYTGGTGLRVQSGDPGVLLTSPQGTDQSVGRATLCFGTSDGTNPIWAMGLNRNNTTTGDWYMYHVPTALTPIYIASDCSAMTFNVPVINPNAFSTKYTITSNVTLAAATGKTITTWNPTSNMNTPGVPLAFSPQGTFSTTGAGIYAIQVHLRFNATAGENACTIFSTGGNAYAGGVRMAVSDNTLYDVCTNFTGYLGNGDGFNIQAYSSIANSVTAVSSDLVTFMQITCLQRCS